MRRLTPYFLAILLALCLLSATAYGLLVYHLRNML
jgi:hypothetical protein